MEKLDLKQIQEAKRRAEEFTKTNTFFPQEKQMPDVIDLEQFHDSLLKRLGHLTDGMTNPMRSLP